MATDFATVGRLLGNEHRATMIDRLMEGAPLASGELARAAGVSPSTASEHLAELARGGLITAVREGRRRYFMIAGPEVATALESLSLICPATPARSLRQSRDNERVAFFRTCYDHLAGSVAVALLDTMVRERWLIPGSPDYEVSARGESHLHQIGIDCAIPKIRRRAFARLCLDWTERRSHLAGHLGAVVAEAFLANNWARRLPTARGLVLTEAGSNVLIRHFHVDFSSSRNSSPPVLR